MRPPPGYGMPPPGMAPPPYGVGAPPYTPGGVPLGARPPPPKRASEEERRRIAAGWSVYKSEDGRIYYYNQVTEESSWTRPEGFQGDEGNVSSKPVPVSSGAQRPGPRAATNAPPPPPVTAAAPPPPH